MGKTNVTENASGAATGAAAIGSTAAPLGGTKRKKGDKEKKVPDTIFAMSAEDIEEINLIRRRAGLL